MPRTNAAYTVHRVALGPRRAGIGLLASDDPDFEGKATDVIGSCLKRGRLAMTNQFLLTGSLALAATLLPNTMTGQTADAKGSRQVGPSTFTVEVRGGVHAGGQQRPPNDQSYELAVLRFNDDGTPVDPGQLAAAAECIARARRSPNGAVVLLFIHGWHHNADWDTASNGGDSHFRAVRTVLSTLTLREAERYSPEGPSGRRVVGVYVGWNGDPSDSWLTKAGPLTHLSFWDRYSTAKSIGEAEHLRQAVRTIVKQTKEAVRPDPTAPPYPPRESPLILIGHSMGALMLESVFLALLKDPSQPLVAAPAGDIRPVEVRQGATRVSFPDVVIALNSAADSIIFKEIKERLREQGLTKKVMAPGVSYSPPLLISATSSADKDTKVIWRAANVLWPGRTTDGHDSTLFTHVLKVAERPVTCNPRGFVDFGQNWHCLRAPEPADAASPAFAIDLPTRDRTSAQDRPPFARYRLTPVQDSHVAQPAWVFQVPPEIIGDHNDIFNSRGSSLMLALIQVSGAVMSLANDWQDTFEPY